ncbi:MAG: threonine/serine exporter family protein [Rikenellaceae bacterium]
MNTSIHNDELVEVAELLLEVATSLMGAGAHTARIVHNTNRMALSFGYEVHFTIFHKTMTVMVRDRTTHESVTLVQPNKQMALNFRMVSELSALSWDTLDLELSPTQAREQYEEIIAHKRLSRWVVLLLVACANASFCRLFGGDFIGMGMVFTSTLIAFFVRQEMMNRHMNHSVVFVTASFISSLIAGLGIYHGWGTTPEIALATSVLFLIPGVPLINSIMDLMEGHILVGIARFVNATILIISITIGFMISLLMLGFEKL